MKRLKLILLLIVMIVSFGFAMPSLPLTGLSLDTRANAMANGSTGELMRNTSFAFHPASWSAGTKINYSISYINWIENMQGGSFSVVLPKILKNKNLGINVTYLDIGTIESFDSDNILIGKTENYFLGIKGNVSFPYKNFFVGGGTTVYFNHIANEMDMYLNFDSAIVWLLTDKIGVGLKIKDLNILFKTDTLFETGVYYHSKGSSDTKKTLAAFNFTGDYSYKISGEQNLHFGLEYIYKNIVLRTGYIFSIGNYKTSHGLSIGFGLDIKNFAFDFSYTPITGMDAPIQMTLRTLF